MGCELVRACGVVFLYSAVKLLYGLAVEESLEGALHDVQKSWWRANCSFILDVSKHKVLRLRHHLNITLTCSGLSTLVPFILISNKYKTLLQQHVTWLFEPYPVQSPLHP